jgi:hypothetical protein
MGYSQCTRYARAREVPEHELLLVLFEELRAALDVDEQLRIIQRCTELTACTELYSVAPRLLRRAVRPSQRVVLVR